MRNPVKAVARRSKSAIILFKLFDNWRLKRRTQSGSIETIHGSTHLNSSVTDSLAYIDRQFNDYLNYAGLRESDLLNKNILELGPGDNLGVALRFIAAGAKCAICLDRFYSKRDPQHEQQIYAALRDNLSDEQRQRLDLALSLGETAQFETSRVRSIYGQTLEEYATSAGDTKFDLIISCAVLEEIYNPDSTLTAMDVLLNPGGLLIHKIDLSDYGMFRNQGMHPLTFLTIPERIYRRMASDSGLPNRKRLSHYRTKMDELRYDAKYFVTSTITNGRIEPALENPQLKDSQEIVSSVRNKLDSEFRNLPEEDLLIDGLLLVARKQL
jgi:hypothetical protein